MYKIFIALIIGCLSKDIFAACPTSLSGKYSGQATYTEFYNYNFDDVAEKLYVVSFDGKGTKTRKGLLTVLVEVEADAGIPGVKAYPSGSTVTYTFDSTNCSMNIYDAINGDIKVVVANSGATLYGVKRNLTLNSVERYILTKQ